MGIEASSLHRVGQEIEHALEGCGLTLSFQELMRIPLAQPGKLLGGAAEPRWPSLVLASGAATGGDERSAITAAAAVEMFMAALDILDDIEDGDNSALVDTAGVPQALNVSTALLMLAQEMISGIDTNLVPPKRVNKMINTLVQAGLEATGGQYADLASEGCTEITVVDALRMTREKAGSLVAGACRLGALIGTDVEELLALYEAWARHFGTMAQLVNDYHDVSLSSTKSDWLRGKQTLPMVFARGLDAESVEMSGALHFTWVVFDLERQAAQRIINDLADRGQRVASLVALLGS